MNCGVHGCEMILRPGGVSKKTGKSYNAFWACPEKNADGTYCSFKPPKGTPTPTPAQNFDAGLSKSGKDMDYDKREKERADGQSWGNAKTNAVNWAIALYQGKELKADAMKNFIEIVANYIHNLEPKKDSGVVPSITERELPIVQVDDDSDELSRIPF